MFSINRYPNVLLYLRNRSNFLWHWKEPFRYLRRRKSFETFGPIRYRHFCFLDSKIVFWSIIWRLYKTKRWNRKWLLGVHEKDSSNYLFKALMALVPSSTFHWYYANLPTFKMVHQTFKENSIRPSYWYWNHCTSTCNLSRMGCHQLLLGHHRLIWRKILTSINRCSHMRDVLLLLLLAFDQ